MAGINIPGVGNKYGTNETVQKLMEVERIPLNREKDSLEVLKKEQDAWRVLNKKSTELRDSVKSLYSFDNPFNNKSAESSDESVLKATATRSAVYEDFNIEVIEVAEGDRFLSSPLEKETKVPMGSYKYQVGEKSVTLKWRGGSLKEFSAALNKRGGKILSSRVIGVGKGKYVLSLESLKTGAINRFVFTGDSRTFALSSGMIADGAPSLQDEAGVSSQEALGEKLPAAGEVGFGGITIENAPFDAGDVAVIEVAASAQSDADIYYDEEAVPEIDYTPLHPITKARDAVIKYEGIQIARPTNSIDDVIPEVTLDLISKSDKAVKVSITADAQSAKDALITFVGKYNQVLSQINILTQNKSDIIDELDYLSEDEKAAERERLGLFLSDTAITGLKSTLQTITQASYNTGDNRTITMLNQVGIATNATNYSGYTPSKLRGYLEIDEKKLDEVLEKHLDEVKALFGFDSDGDLIADDGLACNMDRQLTSYTRTGGIFALKTSGLDTKIKGSESRITRLESQMEKKEAQLRAQYSQMEGALNSLESQQTTIQNFSNRGNKQ